MNRIKPRLGSRLHRVLANEKGIAAIILVVLAIVVIGTLAINFLAETQQKQTGSALTYTSTNAFLVAEAGLRYAEKCLLEGGTTSDCFCDGWSGSGCDGWTSATDTASDIPLVNSDGKFQLQFSEIETSTIKVTSIGKFRGALRTFTKTIAKTCQLQENAITACTSIINNNNSEVEPNTKLSAAASAGTTALSVNSNSGFWVGMNIQITQKDASTPTETAEIASFTGSSVINVTTGLTNSYSSGSTVGPVQETGECDIPEVPALTFPGTCPGEDNFNNDAALNTNKYYCSWTQTATFADNPIPDGTTLWINGNMNLSNNADLQIDGSVTINILGNLTVSNNAQIRLTSTGSLTIHVDGNFTQSGNSKLNNTAGDPADMIVLVGGDGAMSNNITFKGALYGDQVTLELDNNAEIVGSIIVESVTLNNNTGIVFDDSAGSSTEGISVCGASGAASIPHE